MVTITLDGAEFTLTPIDELSLQHLLEAEEQGYAIEEEGRSSLGDLKAMLYLMTRQNHPDVTADDLAARIRIKDVDEIRRAIESLSAGKAPAASETD